MAFGLVNAVILEGRLAFDPKLKTAKNSKKYASFLIFNNQHTANPTEQNPIVRVKDNLAIPCVAWEKIAEYLCNNGKKGDLVSVVGKIRMYKHVNQEGLVVYKLYIQVGSLNFLR